MGQQISGSWPIYEEVYGFAEGGRLFSYLARPAGGTFELWTRDMETGREWKTIALSSPAYFRFSPKRAWAVWSGGAVDLRTGEKLPPRLPEDLKLSQAEFDSESNMLVVSGHYPDRRAALGLWRLGEKSLRFLPFGESTELPCFSLSPNARWLRVQVGNPCPSAAHIFDLETDTKAGQPEENRWVSYLLPNNRGLYRRQADPNDHQRKNQCFVWDYVLQKEVFQLTESLPVDHRARVSKDGRQLINYWPIRAWDLDTGRLLFKLESNNMTMCEFAPDGTRALVEYARDESLTLRDTRTGSTVWTFEHNVFAEGRALGAAAFSPDGHCLLIASGPNVRIWSRRRPEYWWGHRVAARVLDCIPFLRGLGGDRREKPPAALRKCTSIAAEKMRSAAPRLGSA